MRRTASAFVFLSIMIMASTEASAAPVEDRLPAAKVRIVSSLEEVSGLPAAPAVLVFFSLDCHVCWEELFEVRYILEKNGVPIALIGITADSREDLEPFLAKHAFFYPVVSDPRRSLSRRFKVKLEPLTVVIEGGRVVHRDNTAESLEKRREKLERCLLEISAGRLS